MPKTKIVTTELNTCLITGANAGIGRAASLQMAQKGWRVLLACRNQERGLAAQASIRDESGSRQVHLVPLDMGLQESIRGATRKIESIYGRLDAIIHNAADFDISRKGPVYTSEGIESVWATNHLGPVLLTSLLLDLLKKSRRGRVITVASKGLVMHPFLKIRLDDPEFRKGGFSVEKAYYQSKLAQVMYTYWLAEQLEGTGIAATCVRVTNVKIDLNRYPNLSPFMKFMYSMKSKSSIAPERMAETYVFAATADQLPGGPGLYLDENQRPVASSPYSRDPANIERLMEVTNRYLK